jgi:predicted lipoprotein
MWFGPVMQRRSWQWIEGTSPDRERIEALLTSRERVDAGFVREFLGTTQVGLMTMEYLLFPDPDSPDPKFLDTLAGSPAPRCAYLEALGQVAAEEAGFILDDWIGTGESEVAYRDVLTGAASRSLSPDQAVAELVRHMVFLTREITSLTWGAALGGNGGDLDPEAIPGGAANHAVADLRSQLSGIQELYLGADGGDAALGLGDIIRQLSGGIDQGIMDSLEAAIESVERLEEPVARNLVEDPAPAREAIGRVMALERILNTEVASLLNISIGFNDKDGDR